MANLIKTEEIKAKYRFTQIVPDRSKLIWTREDLAIALNEISENADGNSFHKLLLVSKDLVDMLDILLQGSNSLKIIERNKPGFWFKIVIECFSEAASPVCMKRRESIERFIGQLAEAEGVALSRLRHDLMVTEVETAIERGLKADAAPELPTREQLEATEGLYVNRPRDPETGRPQTILKFLETGWPADFIAAGTLSRPAFREIDPQAEQALRNWVRETRSAPPPHLYIPTKSEMIDRELAIEPERVRAAWRIARAHDRRRGGGQEK